MNQCLIKKIARELLGINTIFEDSRKYNLEGQKLDRLLDLVNQSGAECYISGPAAKEYIDEQRFEKEGVKLIWKDYSNYPEYPQRFPPFEHGVSIIDLLFNVGPDSPQFIWGWRH
jgi:hypothetical protein